MSNSYSQFGQDTYINDNIFKNKTNGIFVDIGAHDGITLSNTYLFEKDYNWTGYCFEPIPYLYEKLKTNRPQSKCFDAAISDFDGFDNFKIIEGYAEMLSGLVSNYNPYHKQRINNEIYQFGGNQVDISVAVSQLKNVIPTDIHIDYLSIDTEGGESKCLHNLLGYFQPSVISTEINYPEEINIIEQIMNHNNYVLEKILGVDYIYIKKDLKD